MVNGVSRPEDKLFEEWGLTSVGLCKQNQRGTAVCCQKSPNLFFRFIHTLCIIVFVCKSHCIGFVKPTQRAKLLQVFAPSYVSLKLIYLLTSPK